MPQNIANWILRDFTIESFSAIQRQMKDWADLKKNDYQLWYGEHALVVTKGVRSHNDCVGYWPSVVSNRGGQLTVHLPGQLVFYPLWPVLKYCSLTRYRWILEETVRRTLSEISQDQITTYRMENSPGVYTSQGKISSLGLRLSRECVYHGISLNIACPLRPFHSIVCCGQKDIQATSLSAMGYYVSIARIKTLMIAYFFDLLEQEKFHVHHDTSS
jgi:lipoyl(octanoyl) transferase